MVNFYYVPPEWRVVRKIAAAFSVSAPQVFTSVGLVGWFAFLSFLGHRHKHEGDQQHEGV